ncbi:MAG: hypothetical protein Q8R78_02690 [Candidatus Omnitrophota bacterium]|nr:hypothetical protein [Candidatus Omnitrophota bacterium]
MSPDIGYITERHEPAAVAAAAPAPMVIHIQEAHTNYEGQKHLVAILEQLIHDHGLKLILVEGGQGDVSLAHLRSYGPPENRKAVAEKYLKIGIISGEEYLDIVSDYPLILWGVEQGDLYQRNLEVFLEAEALGTSVTPILASVRSTVESLKPFLADPALNDLQTKTKAFHDETLGLADYAQALADLAAQHGLAERDPAIAPRPSAVGGTVEQEHSGGRDVAPIGAGVQVPRAVPVGLHYPNLQRFREARRLEQTLDLAAVQQEQQAVTKELSLRADENSLKELIAQAKAMKEGQVTRDAFYAHLEQLAARFGLHLEGYPHLSSYIAYLKQRAQLQPTVLADELDALAAKLQEALASTLESRRLQVIEQQLTLVENLVALRLSPDEYQQLQSTGLVGLCSGWETFLSTQAARHGLRSPSAKQLAEVDRALPQLRRFYTTASKRDEALIANTLAKLQETQEPIAVLITGGFHSSKLTQLLKEAGIGTVVVAPKVTQATDEELYHAVVKYKSGRGTFEDVMNIVNKTAPAAASE